MCKNGTILLYKTGQLTGCESLCFDVGCIVDICCVKKPHLSAHNSNE